MLLECRLQEGLTVLIDAEVTGTISKDDGPGFDFHPDDALDNVVKVAAQVGRKLAEAASQASTAFPAPTEIELTFGVRVDSHSVVSVSREASQGQFLVKAVWRT